MSAESHYLNALEALDEGDRDRAKSEAKKRPPFDPEHLEAWTVYWMHAFHPKGCPPPWHKLLKPFLP